MVCWTAFSGKTRYLNKLRKHRPLADFQRGAYEAIGGAYQFELPLHDDLVFPLWVQ